MIEKCNDCLHRKPTHIIDGGVEYDSYTCDAHGVEIKEDSTAISICEKFGHFMPKEEENNIERTIRALSLCCGNGDEMESRCWTGCPYHPTIGDCKKKLMWNAHNLLKRFEDNLKIWFDNAQDEETWKAFRICFTDKKCDECPRENTCKMLNNRKVEIPVDLLLDINSMLVSMCSLLHDKSNRGEENGRNS